mgnify:CR=1 FL=1
MNHDDQIRCGPYSCTLSVSGCADRYARAQEKGQRGRARASMAACKTCEPGRERWVHLGSKPKPAPQTVPDLRRIRERSLAVYIPRGS